MFILCLSCYYITISYNEKGIRGVLAKRVIRIRLFLYLFAREEHDNAPYEGGDCANE